MSDHSHEGEEIRRRMEEVRGELRHEAQDMAASARVMTDWRYYWRAYPWACMGAAAAAGYLLVPRRMRVVGPDAETLLQLAEEKGLLVKAEAEPTKRGGFLTPLFTLAANTIVRGLISYAGQQAGRVAGQYVGTHTAEPPPAGVAPRPR